MHVLETGSIAVGDQLFVDERPLPHLSLRRVSMLCYGEARSRISCAIDAFNGTEAELKELLACELLARFEWRDRLVQLCERRARNDAAAATARAEQLRRTRLVIAASVVLVVLLGVFLKIRENSN